MSGFADPGIVGFDPVSGTVALPLWSAGAIAAAFVAFGILVVGRIGREGTVAASLRAGLLLAGAAVALVALERTSAGTFAAERKALDARWQDMTTRTLMPGSALACLDAVSGALVEASCEKAVFASPEAVAAAVAYVTAQLSLLADGSDYARRSGASYETVLTPLRHAIETDRFGIVAHVLADRDGCTGDHCESFAMLRDSNEVSENLSGHKYESNIMHHALDWPQSALSPVAVNAPVPAQEPASPASPVATQSTAPSGKPASGGLYFPSSASIPAVSIMAAEPTLPPAVPDTSAKASASTTRKGAAAAQPVRRPANIAPPAHPAATPDQGSEQQP